MGERPLSFLFAFFPLVGSVGRFGRIGAQASAAKGDDGGGENDEGRRDGLGPTFWGGRRQTFIFCLLCNKWDDGGQRQVAKINKSICRRERTVLLPLRSRPVRNPAAKK